jgi:hypothetical protein
VSFPDEENVTGLARQLALAGCWPDKGAQHRSTMEGTYDSSRPRRKRLTATVTATAATNGYQQRSATAHNTRKISNTLTYAMPGKRTV